MADSITLDDVYGLFRVFQAKADQRLQQLEQLQAQLSQAANAT
jgi:hypothetical protein